eukprot:TRINITY_DN2409_c0_g2_i1.p1 TRINITY_DN2409_c0_g2~~TRINITY_DN2409_c0_g2_i1.p1  ORF type:complete len:242 (+),score=63.63 TRINITY_DN2409_c0_g2_i1:54-728(+)
MSKRVAIVLSNHEQLGNTGKKTGWYLPEAAHPWHVLREKGIESVFVSGKGGLAPLDPSSLKLDDPVNKEFWEGKEKEQTENTRNAADLDPKDFSAVLFAGGHGTMWDFPESASLIRLAEGVWAHGGVVAAVCHGPAGIVNLKDKDGEYIVKGKNVGGFTNDEEAAVGLTNEMPFSLETRLIERGGKFSKADNWKSHVVVDGRLITGQNPQSAKGVGEELAKLLA